MDKRVEDENGLELLFFRKLVINKKIYFTQLHLHVIQIDKEKETTKIYISEE